MPYILCTTSLTQPTSTATCDPKYINQSTSSKGSPFSLACVRPPFPYLEHLITLFLPTFTLNFLLSHALPNSFISLHNFPLYRQLVLYQKITYTSSIILWHKIKDNSKKLVQYCRCFFSSIFRKNTIITDTTEDKFPVKTYSLSIFPH